MKKYALKDLLKDHVKGHSAFQQDYFITGRAGGGTPYGQYKQALRELYKRVRGHRDLTYNLEKIEIDIDELDNKITPAKFTNDFDRRRDLLELKRKRMLLEEASRSVEDNKRELIRFYQHACVLKQQLERSGPLTPERMQQLDEIMWLDRAKRRIAVDFMIIGRISGQTLELILSMPKSLRSHLIQCAKNGKELVGWLETTNDDFMTESLPEPGEPYPPYDFVKLAEID